MSRLIDADKIVYSWQIDADGQEHDGVTLESIINKMPTIEPDLTAEEWNLVKKLRSYHNGSYAHVLDKLIAAASQPEQLGNLWKSAFESSRTYEKEEIVHFLDEIKEQLGYEQPEIIHCCDCKYSSKDMIFDEYFCSKKTRSNCVAEDHYCGDAERREE